MRIRVNKVRILLVPERMDGWSILLKKLQRVGVNKGQTSAAGLFTLFCLYLMPFKVHVQMFLKLIKCVFLHD